MTGRQGRYQSSPSALIVISPELESVLQEPARLFGRHRHDNPSHAAEANATVASKRFDLTR